MYAFNVPFLRGSACISLCYLLSVASNFEAPIVLTIYDTSLLFLWQVRVEETHDYCQSGHAAVKNEVEKLWKIPPFNSNCNNTWNLQAAADDLKDDKFRNNTSNWVTDSCNQCARDYGVDPEVDKILKQCLDNDSSQCIALGETAASIIVYANVCGGYSAENHQDYLQTCREVAYGICEGAIRTKIEEQCPDQLPVSTTELNSLMGMCVEQVDSMTGGGDKHEEAYKEAYEEAYEEAEEEAESEAN